MPTDSKQRFSDRVDHYARHRPGYPEAVITVLREELGMESGWEIADVGSGTGISSELFLAHGHRVFAVEPNRAMREAAEALHRGKSGFHSVDGSAESTGLPEGSIDLVVAAQAFHWFDPDPTRSEFRRILREPCPVAIMWNVRRRDASRFMAGYEALVEEFRTDHDAPERDLDAFFQGRVARRVMPHERTMDLDAIQGLLLSASYTPRPDHERHRPMLEALHRLFERHSTDGRIRFLYETQLFVGKLA